MAECARSVILRSAEAPRILALWSAPRCRSTAFFRMMSERGDFRLLHEPFSYLMEFGSVDAAGREISDEAGLLARIRELSADRPLFFKDTTDERCPGLLADAPFLERDALHTFIIRHPRETIASYYAINPEVRLHQIGFEAQYELFERVQELTGTVPAVVDAADLVEAPERTVRAYCAAARIPYVPEALQWSSGSREEWAPSEKWHRDASASSGFEKKERGDRVDVDTHPVLSEYLAHHLPFYEKLRAHRLGV
ncbi:sulfotransferase family protein [Streptomyces sp. NPDC051162]|uniref:sulfotransferase-like domain-containing protein n=1 Tax=unclassified Streptomyces TaxID=2593676 RepID=UPI003431506B